MKYFLHSVVFVVVGLLAIYAYLNYGDEIYYAVFNEPAYYNIFVGTVAIDVTIANTEEERKLGLSNTKPLKDLQGKLFLFDKEGFYGMWMKDMNYPIDIIWVNNDLEIVHIEENVSPETYPKVFGPDEPARYVLETKAFFVSTYKIKEGFKLTMPPGLLPMDIKSAQELEYSER